MKRRHKLIPDFYVGVNNPEANHWVHVSIGDLVYDLTEAEAIRLANMLVDAVEARRFGLSDERSATNTESVSNS